MIFDLRFIRLVAVVISIGVAQGLNGHSTESPNPTNSSITFLVNPKSPFRLSPYDFQVNSDIIEFSKRDQEPETIGSIVYALVSKLKELGLDWLMNEKLFAKIVKKGTDRELHFPIGVTHRVFKPKYRKEFNLGYCAKQRNTDTPASRRNAGENFGGIQNADDGYTLVSVISGNSGFFPAGTDSADLCKKMDDVVSDFFLRVNKTPAFLPGALVEFTWEISRGAQSPPGCFSILHAIINPQNQIRITNLGPSWAGLYRNEELVQSTEPQIHEDGSGFQVCNALAGLSPGPIDFVEDSVDYMWQAQKNDIFVVVSKGVREVLSTKDIENAFSLIKKLGSEANAFRNERDIDLYAMGIIKAARIASGGQPKADLLAGVVKIGAVA